MKVLILYREISKVMLAHEPTFNTMVSEILGCLDVLPFSLPELTASPTICCIVLTSGQETDSETELGPCSTKLTASKA